jgi:phage gpG-like protein
MSSVEIDLSALTALANKLSDTGKITDALLDGMQVATVKLANYAADSKLEGGVLQHRSGRLSSSVRHPPEPTLEGDVVTGYIKSVFYGAVHEFGATINANVQLSDGSWRYIRQLPPRPWLAPSIEEQQDMIIGELSKAVSKAFKDQS